VGYFGFLDKVVIRAHDSNRPLESGALQSA